MHEICQCAKLVKKSSVEHTATLRAWSVKNDLNIAKYREQVEKEINEEKDNWRLQISQIVLFKFHLT